MIPTQVGPAVTAPRPVTTVSAHEFELWRSLSHRSRVVKRPKGADVLHVACESLVHRLTPSAHADRATARRAETLLAQLRGESPSAYHERLARLKRSARTGGLSTQERVEAIATAALAAEQSIELSARHVQMWGVSAMLRGQLAEIATGEGKTLVAAMTAAIESWAGRGCHVVTVNDYLASRDADWMRPLFTRLGATVASVVATSTPDERRAAYRADVTYCTNKEAAADYLRDQLAQDRARSVSSLLCERLTSGARRPSRPPLTRSPYVAIVDEADSVLIDESTTPLIISGGNAADGSAEVYEFARSIAGSLSVHTHFEINLAHREVRLTGAGRRAIRDISTDTLHPALHGERRREELVTQALSASFLYLRDKHYIISDGAIVIIDEATGRLMPDRTWRDGMHQAIQAKERIEITGANNTLARISFQRYFQIYPKLAGMSGTLKEETREIWRTFRRRVCRIPTHRPIARVQMPTRTFANERTKLRAVIARVLEMSESGRPVLVGTRSVRASFLLSAMLEQREIPHRLLNANTNEEEAAIVAEAGQRQRITISTNMAGRGTDILLSDDVERLGGLHVIATELHESSRVERQLYGRAGRQGQAGSAELVVSLDDEVLRVFLPPWVRSLARRLSSSSSDSEGRVPRIPAWILKTWAHRRARAHDRRRRLSVMRADEWVDESLGLAS